MVRLTLRQITILHAILRGGSAASAAQALHISQPAVSKIIAAMEQELGYSLFKRIGRGLEPTAEALGLMPYVEDALGSFDKLQQHAGSLRSGAAGTISVATNYTLFASLLAGPTSEIRKRYPKINLEVRILPAPQITEAVLTHQVDVGLTYGPLFNPNVISETIARRSAVCVFPEDDDLRGSREVHASDVSGRPMITFAENTPIGLAFRRLFENLDLEFSPNLILGNTPSILEMVSRRTGIGLVDHFSSFAAEFPSLTCSPIAPRIEISTVLFWLRASQPNQPALDLMDLIREAANNMLG